MNLLLLGFPVLSFASREPMAEGWIDCRYGEFSQAGPAAMLRRSKIFIVIGSKFATSSVGAKSNSDWHANRLWPRLLDGWDLVRYVAPTELAALLVRSAIKIYLLRRIERCPSTPADVLTALEAQPRERYTHERRTAQPPERQTPNAAPRTVPDTHGF